MTSDEFKLYVFEWARKIGVSSKIKEIHIRKLKKKVASCSNKGRLTFDISILNKEKNEIDYIIVHELLHLKYPNHGKMFKILLKDYLEEK